MIFAFIFWVAAISRFVAAIKSWVLVVRIKILFNTGSLLRDEASRLVWSNARDKFSWVTSTSIIKYPF